jgi:two-component system sensor histidine kinase AtoS
MSLRARILWLFAIFAVVPILAVGIVDYIVSVSVVRELVHQRLEVVAPAAVGSTTENGLAAAYNIGRATRLLFVMVVMLVTSVAFSLLINRVMRSLGKLTAAAEAIGRGDFTPWLPPPGEDEVGRLSFALGSMVERVGQMLRQVEQNRQLAVVGEFASYLAHEIRNPLSSLKLNLQGAARDVRAGEVGESLPQVLETCVQEINRLDRVVHTILRLGRTEPGVREPCSVHEVLDEAVALIGVQLTRRRIRVQLQRQAFAQRVLASAEQLKGVFLNLFLNAADAMPQGGRLRIWTRNDLAHDGGPAVWIHIADDGAGIPPELRERIFDPFFTTKRDGSGIGLSLALRTLRDYGGDLTYAKSSEIEPGSEFIIVIPLLYPDEDDAEPGSGAVLALEHPEYPIPMALTDPYDRGVTL